MKRQTIILLLLIAAVGLLAYAIYRSTGEQIIVTQNNVQTIYGEPQHGLILGLCILSGLCVLATIPLLLYRRDLIEEEEPPVTNFKKRPL
jgi:hypothetical protein